MIIKNYEVIINEKNATCGLVIDEEEYEIDSFKEETLFYEVFPEKKIISVYNQENTKKLEFINADHQLIYYAFKTIELPILVGKTNPEPKINFILEAQLK